MQLEIFDVKKNIDDYSAESYTGIYGVHKYWSKKPYNIIRHFIEKYSQVEEIVLDPFCGSGISIIESILSNRKAVGFDINPSAIFITKQMLNKISTSKLYESYLKIESKVKDDINSLYVIERENKKYLATHFIWEENKLTEIWVPKTAQIRILQIQLKVILVLSVNSITIKSIITIHKMIFFIIHE
ncbi:MAG: site-specific DNA-methyltransferase [Ignavibacteriaceae bacterium]|nr:site-specific DNA-methyltransferase [Ignavibacteriaceae bacterium]